MREEVDLAQLTQQLLDVVQDTMQPAHISLWLRHRHPLGYENKCAVRVLPAPFTVNRSTYTQDVAQ